LAERVVVACVQQRMHLPLTLDEYREDLRRFMRVAATKQARLVVFPELGGVMVAPPILRDFRSQLLKRADRGRRRNAGLWDRLVGGVAGVLSGAVGADFRRGLGALLDVAAHDLWCAYGEVFGGLAREFGMTVVAPSAYLPDPVDGVIRNLSVVFDSSGQMVGHQAKVVLHPADTDLAQAGTTWDVIATEVGRIGLILGSDVLYPEVGRLLAYQGADLFVVQAASTDELLYQKLRAASLARMQDNQLFAATSFLIGDNQLSHVQRTPFVGKSALFAPQELTPRSNGVLVEMGNLRSEGVLAAQWDFAALRALWETSETPVRRQLPLQQAGQVLAQLYAKLQALPKVAEPDQLTTAASSSASASAKLARVPVQSLDDLVVIATATQRWPLLQEQSAIPTGFASVRVINDETFVTQPNGLVMVDEPSTESMDEIPDEVLIDEDVTEDASEDQTGEESEESEDETDEMDAVAGVDRSVSAGDSH
jgi:predicted amidohydrolase